MLSAISRIQISVADGKRYADVRSRALYGPAQRSHSSLRVFIRSFEWRRWELQRPLQFYEARLFLPSDHKGGMPVQLSLAILHDAHDSHRERSPRQIQRLLPHRLSLALAVCLLPGCGGV
jgi:hypothetical protein